MATWQEIGVDNFSAARNLLNIGQYRSSISRFYYAAFRILTSELARSGMVFKAGRETPSHAELPGLVRQHLTQFSEERRDNIARLASLVYRLRLEADYSLGRVGRETALTASRYTLKILNYFGLGRGEI